MAGQNTHELELGREAMVSFGSRIAMMAFGFAGVVLFARVLGPAGIGAYYLVLSAGQTISQVSNGIGAAIKKRVSEAGTDPREYLTVGLLAHAVLTLVVAGTGNVTSPIVERFVEVPNLVVSLTIIVFSLGLFQITNALYAGIGYPGYAHWVDMIRSVLTLLFQVIAILLGWGPFGLVVAFAAASFLTGLGVWTFSGVVPRLPARSVVVSTTQFARWSVPNSLVGKLYGRLDVILIGVLAGNTAVGFYETALRLVQPGAFFATSISGPLQVKVSGLSSRSHDVVPDLKNAISYAGLLSIPLFFGTIAMSLQIMRTVFGPEFTGAWPALVGLALFQIMSAYGKSFHSILSGSDEMHLELSVSTVILVVYLPIAVVLGNAFGLLGVIGATVVSEVVRIGLYQFLTRRLFGQFVVPRPIAEQFLAGIAMAAAVITVLSTVVTVTGWPWLLLTVGFGAGVYFGSLFVLSRHFRETLENVLPIPMPYSI